MFSCALCQCKSFKKFRNDIVVDKIGNPPILLCELLLQITIDLDYKLATTELCSKCTHKLGRYYKTLQVAEQMKLEIIELIQNQVQIANETLSMVDFCLNGGDENEINEIIGSSEIVFKMDENCLMLESDTNLNEIDLKQNNIVLENNSTDEPECDNNLITSKDYDEEIIKNDLYKSEICIQKNEACSKLKIKDSSISKNSKRNSKKQLKKKREKKLALEEQNTNISMNKEANANDGVEVTKKSIDCSKSKGIFMYTAGEVGQPLGIRCEFCDRVFQYARTFYAHKKYQDFAGYVCEICGITCLTKVGIKDHAKIHNPDKEFQCPQCNAQFHRKLLFDQHMSYHTDERPFKCDVCSKSFAHRIALKVHKKIHTDNYRRIECEFCDKKFRTVTHKRRHMPIHTGAKPFTCRFCGNRFSQADNMRAHMKLLHGFTVQKDVDTQPLNCSNCSMDFQNLLEYEEHTKICS